MNVICLGLSHHTAHVELREKFAFPEADITNAISRLGTMDGIREMVIVSTCNRVELYSAVEDATRGFQSIERFLAERCGIHEHDGGIFYRHHSPQSVRHLFRVVSGLESMVLGETEILGQVKKAYSIASENGGTSRHLNKLFQRAFRVAKEVRSNTNITRGPVSVGAAAVDLSEKIFGQLAACGVMILGAGQTSEQTARALFARGVRSIFVANRSYDRAAELASQMGGRAIHFDQWHNEFGDIDILISSTAAPHPILTPEKLQPVMRQRRDRPLFVIDLAVPRDVDPAVNDLDGVYLYDIDSLEAIAQQSLESRRNELAACEGMIEKHVAEFSTWLSGCGVQTAGGGLGPMGHCQASKS
jgi:glutamyl-tRNA reductase